MSAGSDVIIIGAGISGLCAAVELLRAGKEVRILEARDRLGGRIFTRRDSAGNAAMELGAEFIHGRPPEIWDLLRAEDISPTEVQGEDWCFRDGELRACDWFSDVDKVLDKMDDSAPDQSFLDFLQRCAPGPEQAEITEWALGYVSGFHAADPGLISVHSLVKGLRADETIDGERAFRIPGGYEVLIESQRRELDDAATNLNTLVNNIAWRRGHAAVEARTDAGVATFTSARVLITVPLGVLQAAREDAGGLTFVPELPFQKQDALERLVMGKALRVSLRFRERFWEKLRPAHSRESKTLHDMRFLFSRDPWFPTWWTTMPEKLPIITGWAPFHSAERMSREGGSMIVATALASLGRMLRVDDFELQGLLESAAWHDWQADPFSRGAYSYVKAGGTGAQADLAAPLEDTLYFAGEATDFSGHNGTVHGAIASARRAVREILAA